MNPRFLLFNIFAYLTVLSVSAKFTAVDTVVINKGDGTPLGATITLPAESPAKALLVLASGSGSQDRDEQVFGHRPFRTLAEYLSQRGYAVARFDDRGVGQSGGDPSSVTAAVHISDLRAMLGVLDSIAGTGISKGIIGHSEGGSMAIRMARGPQCDFIITLGAPAWQGDSIIMSQARAVSVLLMGRWDGENLQRRILDLVKSPVPTLLLRPQLYALLAGELGPAAETPQGKELIAQQIGALCSASYREMVRYNPESDIRAVAVPWLALNGDKDIQVLPANLSTIAALNPAADTRLLPSHNHLGQRCDTGLIQEYATISEDLSPLVLETIATWLDNTVRNGK